MKILYMNFPYATITFKNLEGFLYSFHLEKSGEI